MWPRFGNRGSGELSTAPTEDARGIDVVVETDVGKLYLQCKSSHAAARCFRAKKRSSAIAVVVMSPDADVNVHRAIGALRMLRSRVLAIRER